MRNNSPVTQKEYDIPSNYILVSETDLQGNIIFANQEFIEVSGFTWEELKGQPHNLIRHPDVPEKVFEDLWCTLKKGRPWHQLVKNRCKNGDHYWVEANIAPVFQNGKIVGYKSIRNPISQKEVAAAENAYGLIRKGKRLIKNGVVMAPFSQKLARLSPLPQKSILGKTIIPLIVMAIILSAALQIYLQNVADNLYSGAVKDRQELLLKNLDSEIASQSQIALTNAVGIAGNSAVIYGLYDHQDTVLWQIVKVNYEQYVKRANMPGIGLAIFDANLKKVANSGVNVDVESIPAETQTKVHFQKEGGYVQAQVPVPYGDKIIGLVVVSLPLTQVANLEKESKHGYAALTFEKGQFELTESFKTSPIKQLLKDTNKQRLTSQGYTVVDNTLLVLGKIKHGDQLVGAHLISEPMVILDKLLSDTYFMIYVSQIAMTGGFILLLIQVYWRMRSFVLKPLQSLTQKLLRASKEGSLSVRADVENQDEIGRMATNFNLYVTSVQQLMIGVSDMVSALSKGDLDHRYNDDAKGDLNILKTDVNMSADKIKDVISELERAIHCIKEATYDFESQTKFEGDFSVMVSDLQNAMQVTHEAVRGINSTMKDIAAGEFSSRLNANLMGELDALKININHSLDQLEDGITETVNVIVAQSKGDLTQRVEGDYQGKLNVMKDALNASLDNVSGAVSGLMLSSQTVSDASSQIASGSQDLSDRIQQQASTLQETVNSMESITHTVRKNAESAKEASDLASEAKKQADSGAEVMSQTMNSMQELSESSQKISDIIGLIDSIAFQTNLLALNAAVEAARAGEQGRGFAVVAGEVRTLAGKSAEAAKEIRSLIETSVGQVGHSESLVEKSEQEFSSILNMILQMDRFISDIAQANNEQTQSIEEINEAVEDMDGVTQQNAALVEETAHAADMLRGESEEMRSQVAYFQVKSLTNSNRLAAPKKTAVAALPNTTNQNR
ncbi:methyl-accepting chemotaxis protein [Hydrogenovibrio sp. 3SP14C1]|uniref:methyl-accepting chemotaxis protein n=1 Tax=Hydrogenovibrio sp. 3SP14C1 TaxID=3038774 RepID=UPI00241683D6|nr:methyl-accepting chemotaxis protein [Hydrogenovibrio sp. 3SP14C1]MDG4811411.1 methyl-accepting chemotaxis protein [Hydrogenovibrio sp. 3SP14C1]